MRLLIPFLLLTTAAPAAAEVTHVVQGRFGVSYSSAAGGQTQPLYEGRYTTTFSHQSDNGLTFRFELGVALGNIDERRPWPVEPRTVSVGVGDTGN